jgi:hypothetical protein
MNEHKGEWDDGVWYSNNSYKPYVAPITTYDWKDSKYDWKKNVTTIRTVALPKPKVIAIGALVELLEDIADPATLKVYETGELCEIVAVNKDFTCDLMHDDYANKSSFLYNVPYHSLSFVDEFEDDSIDPVGIPAYHNYASPSLLKGSK